MTDAERDAAFEKWEDQLGPPEAPCTERHVDAWNAAWAARQEEVDRLNAQIEHLSTQAEVWALRAEEVRRLQERVNVLEAKGAASPLRVDTAR